MKEGRTLQELAAEIQRQAELKVDYVGSTDKMRVQRTENSQALALSLREDVAPFTLQPLALQQIRTTLDIPATYFDRLKTDHPEFLVDTVNYFFEKEPSPRMVRTLGVDARAFLSNRYRQLDHIDMLEAILPVLGEMQVNFRSTEVTASKLYLKVLIPGHEGEVRRGDYVRGGFVISNSEVGQGALSVDPFLERLVCVNGMIVSEHGLRHHHLGKRLQTTEQIEKLYSNEALAADDYAFWLKFRDVVRGLSSIQTFQEILSLMRASTERTLEPQKAAGSVEVLAQRYQLSKDESNSVLGHLIAGGDLSQYGLLNAVTRTATDAEHYDRATDLEALGGRVLTLEPSEWRIIAQGEVETRKGRKAAPLAISAGVAA